MEQEIIKEIQQFVKDCSEKPFSKLSGSITSLLDDVVKALNLKTVYVVENSLTRYHFIYSYVSHGEKFKSGFYNLIVFPQGEYDRLVALFDKETHLAVFDGNISSSQNATAADNLAYGYIEDSGDCLGFVSFQPKDATHVWTAIEKRVLISLSRALSSFVFITQADDRRAFEHAISNTKGGILWYYPKLHVLVVSERTMEKYHIPNFIFQPMPDAFAEAFASPEDKEKVSQAFSGISKDASGTSLIFQGKDHANYHLTLRTGRFDPEKNPVEVLCLLERLKPGEKAMIEENKVNTRYRFFHEAISNSDILEFYVDLYSHELTLFKAEPALKKIFADITTFPEFTTKASQELVAPSDKDVFLQIMKIDYLKKRLTIDDKTMVFDTRFIIDGKLKWVEISVVLSSTTIYNRAREIMFLVRDITDTESSNFDRLTGLSTMSYFIHSLNEERKSLLLRDLHPKAYFIYIDIMKFRLYNLEKSLKSGDEILVRFSALLRKEYPDGDIAHFSGGHFVLYTRDGDTKHLMKMLTEANQLDPTYSLVFHAGVYLQDLHEEINDACDYAKMACHAIKKVPRSTYFLYSDALKRKVEKENYVVENVDKAIKNGWIKVYYQPVVSTKTGKLVSCEALSRWIDPKYGFLSPADFIPALEKNSLIYKVDLEVIRQICTEIKRRKDLGLPIVPCSFNLSRTDFFTSRPFETIQKYVHDFGLDPKYFCVEITESVVMEDSEQLRKAIDNFHAAGYEAWMDDFGSGYSSLNVLKDFPFDELKLDMGFMRDFNERSKIIIADIVKLSRDLKIRTLCEGVETEEQLAFLKGVGVERIQGYYYSKPLPIEELLALLKEKKIAFASFSED